MEKTITIASEINQPVEDFFDKERYIIHKAEGCDLYYVQKAIKETKIKEGTNININK